jgi:hypothetical protein
MFVKKIEFIAHEDYIDICDTKPVPIKYNRPNWYKRLTHTVNNLTVKGCMPFLDTLTTGYLLKIPQDLHIQHNVLNSEGQRESFFNPSLKSEGFALNLKRINLNQGPDNHPSFQLEGSPLVEKNKNLPFLKILNPWIIKTPPGYSCLFLPPMNNSDDRFSILPSIVDTDTFTNEINFPIVINGDKYPILDTIIEKGLPYVQVIPFKREGWEMSIKSKSELELTKLKISYKDKMLHVYKTKFWSKKKWK